MFLCPLLRTLTLGVRYSRCFYNISIFKFLILLNTYFSNSFYFPSFLFQEAGDLSFKKGDKFAVRSQRRDGWWEADNLGTGESGMIPSNFMRVYTFYSHSFNIRWSVVYHLCYDGHGIFMFTSADDFTYLCKFTMVVYPCCWQVIQSHN